MKGGDEGKVWAYRPPPCHLSRVTYHLRNRFFDVFLLAFTASLRQNTSTYLDEASLTEL